MLLITKFLRKRVWCGPSSDKAPPPSHHEISNMTLMCVCICVCVCIERGMGRGEKASGIKTNEKNF